MQPALGGSNSAGSSPMGRMHTLLSRVSKSCLSPSNSVQQPHEGTGPFDDSEVMDLVESLEDGAESLVGEVNDSTHPGVVWQYNVSSNPELTRARQKGCGHYRTISHDTNISEDFDRLLDVSCHNLSVAQSSFSKSCIFYCSNEVRTPHLQRVLPWFHVQLRDSDT